MAIYNQNSQGITAFHGFSALEEGSSIAGYSALISAHIFMSQKGQWNEGWDEAIKDKEKEGTKLVHHPALKHVKENVGSQLNKALWAIEDENADALQDVLKGINFNRKIGQHTLDDDTLADFVLTQLSVIKNERD